MFRPSDPGSASFYGNRPHARPTRATHPSQLHQSGGEQADVDGTEHYCEWQTVEPVTNHRTILSTGMALELLRDTYSHSEMFRELTNGW